jgi:DNA-binding ferritin-like protein (Dps family)
MRESQNETEKVVAQYKEAMKDLSKGNQLFVSALSNWNGFPNVIDLIVSRL